MENKDMLSGVKEALEAVIPDLMPIPCDAQDSGEYEYITFDGFPRDNLCWKELIKKQLPAARTFELHCWEDEKDAIALGLKFGSIKPSGWKGGVIIAGDVTEEFCRMLLALPLPRNIGFARLNPFFSVVLDNGFSSEHYGTENIIKK